VESSDGEITTKIEHEVRAFRGHRRCVGSPLGVSSTRMAAFTFTHAMKLHRVPTGTIGSAGSERT
jgi:hypothetical protein